ncbi:MAG: BrnT family toxin [Nitrosospira sp.]|nr:BrnT family toxin [Nitrosospira sp.]
MYCQFEWDSDKAASNWRKHKIRFETALRVFADPLALTHQDRTVGGEQRWQTIGMVENRVLLLVAHTIDEVHEGNQLGEIIRIISARRADPTERRRYEQEKSYTQI